MGRFYNVFSCFFYPYLAFEDACCMDTKIQSFQFRIIHRIIRCNQWIQILMIKNGEQCNYCSETDDMRHLFRYCPKVHTFWELWANWWNSINKIYIRKANDLEECILFGFSGNDNLTQVLNYCMMYTKYYIYIQRLSANNHLELYAYLILLKYNLNIECQICKHNNRTDKFGRILFLHDNL